MRQLTPLRISKVLLGDTAGEPPGQTYDMSYSCIDGSGVTHEGSNSIAAGGSWTTESVIPLGSTCTVTEGDLPDLSPRNIWGPVTFDVTLDVAGQPTDAPEQVTRDARSHSFVVPAAEDNAIPHVSVTNRLLRAEAGYLVAKTSDPPSGTVLVPGDTVTYTVTVTPTGPGSTDAVVVTDDLSQVVPYATVALGDASQGTATLVADTLTWSVGTISGATPLTLTYTATVKDGAYGATLRNHVTADGDVPPDACEPCETDHPVTHLWTLEKSSNPPTGSTIAPDTDITYTLRVTNRSSVAPLPAGTSRHRRPQPGPEPRHLRRTGRRLPGNGGPLREHADLDAARRARGHQHAAPLHGARRPRSRRRGPAEHRDRTGGDTPVRGLHDDSQRPVRTRARPRGPGRVHDDDRSPHRAGPGSGQRRWTRHRTGQW